MDKFILILCLITLGCKSHTQKIDNNYCKLHTIDSKTLTNSRDFSRLKQLVLKIPNWENVKNEIIIFRQYPNGGLNEDILSYVTILKDNSEKAKVYFFKGRDFVLVNSYSIDGSNLKKILSEFETGFYNRNCECDGMEDGIFFIGNSRLTPSFGLLFSCYDPTSWTNLTLIEKNVLKIKNLITVHME